MIPFSTEHTRNGQNIYHFQQPKYPTQICVYAAYGTANSFTVREIPATN